MGLLDDLLEREDLYFTEFPEGWSFLWRLLTIEEYRKFRALRASGMFHSFYLHWKVFERCYQGDPKLLNVKMPLGVPLSIGELILYLSGDCESVTIRDELAAVRSIYDGKELTEVMKQIVMSAFPAYSPEELNKHSRIWLLKRFVEAESMLSFKVPGYKPLELSKIVAGNETKKENTIRPINFDAENVAIRKQVSPWDQTEVNEKDYEAAQKKIKKLTPEQAKELDRRNRRG